MTFTRKRHFFATLTVLLLLIGVPSQLAAKAEIAPVATSNVKSNVNSTSAGWCYDPYWGWYWCSWNYGISSTAKLQAPSSMIAAHSVSQPDKKTRKLDTPANMKPSGKPASAGR